MADLRSYVVGLAATADNLSAPSNDIQFVGNFGFIYDGSTWDRMPGTAADGVLVNLGSNNDVTVTSGSITADTELPVAAALADNAANPTAPAVGAFLMLWDGATWDRGPGTAADGQLVNLGANNDVTVTSGSITADTELPTAAALADATANPTVPAVGGFLMGYNGTTWDRVRTANSGRFQVDVITGGGSDTPTGPVNDYATSAGLAAGSTATLDSAEAAAKKLQQICAWTSVAYKAAVHTVDNGVESTNPVAIGGGQAFQPWVWAPRHRSYVTLGTTAGADKFRVKMTNLDDSNAADVFATFEYES